jgi:hypothetical protein
MTGREPGRNSMMGPHRAKPTPVAAGFGVRGCAPLSGAGLMAAQPGKPSPRHPALPVPGRFRDGESAGKPLPARPHRKAPHSGALQSLRPSPGNLGSSVQTIMPFQQAKTFANGTNGCSCRKKPLPYWAVSSQIASREAVLAHHDGIAAPNHDPIQLAWMVKGIGG